MKIISCYFFDSKFFYFYINKTFLSNKAYPIIILYF
ncbi:hypothetical protein C806_04485 [Lachnospiraceae bacterium 3-1]|nr:hypothetical protein C806_04485 [Lachnospiraceae bacterium 3-1]